jgi:hypothetical protein
MSHWIERIKALIPQLPSQEELDQAYLNDAVDIFDVERRMAEIDHRPRHLPLPFLIYRQHLAS